MIQSSFLPVRRFFFTGRLYHIGLQRFACSECLNDRYALERLVRLYIGSVVALDLTFYVHLVRILMCVFFLFMCKVCFCDFVMLPKILAVMSRACCTSALQWQCGAYRQLHDLG